MLKRFVLAAAIAGGVSWIACAGGLPDHYTAALHNWTGQVIMVLACSAMAGALGYCCKRLAIRLWSIPWQVSLIMIALPAFQGGCMAAWLYAMWRDVQQDQLAAFAVDLILPLGAVRGLLMWFGYV